MSPALRGGRRIYSPPAAIPRRMDGKSGRKCGAAWGANNCQLEEGHHSGHSATPERITMPEVDHGENAPIRELNDFAYSAGAYTTNRIETFLQRNIVLRRETPAGGEVTYNMETRTYRAGSGPETAGASASANPNRIRNMARNYLAIADHIERESAETARKDELCKEFAAVTGCDSYWGALPGMRAMIDRIYELEQQAKPL